MDLQAVLMRLAFTCAPVIIHPHIQFAFIHPGKTKLSTGRVFPIRFLVLGPARQGNDQKKNENYLIHIY
jgi:hypothetical protein